MDATRITQGMNARAAIDLAMLQEELLDLSTQAGIFSAMLAWLSAMLAWLSAAPGIIAALRDLQRLAEHGDWVVVAVLCTEREA
jgi:hypothetical protein